MHPSRRLVGGAIVAILTGTVACGLQSMEPKLELRDAVSAFSAAGSGGFRLSFPSSMAAVRASTDEAFADSCKPPSQLGGAGTPRTARVGEWRPWSFAPQAPG